MPSEKMNIIYCTEVDNDDRVIGTSMIILNVHRNERYMTGLLRSRRGD